MVLVPICLYLLLFLPFFGLVPIHDGNTEFKIAYNFYIGKYLSNWQPYHPPLKLILDSSLFHIFGIPIYSYIGFYLGILGIIAFYYTAERMFNKKIAMVSSSFLAISGLYIANSLFSLNDFLETVLLLIAFCFYVRSRMLLYGLAAMLAVLAKESAIMFAVSVLLVDILLKRKISVSQLLPFIAFQAWLWFLFLTGHTLWNSWDFSSVSQHGSAFTLIDNILTFRFLNKYLLENLLHLLIFNFNWIFSLVIFITILFNWRKLRYLKTSCGFLLIVVFSLVYACTIFSFQTYTINRYVLPILPFVYLFAVYGLSKLQYKYFFTLVVAIFAVISLFTSIDPVSNSIWHTYNELGQNFYLSNLDGPDAITYNLQFLELVKKRDEIVVSGNCQKTLSQLDFDRETFALYHLPGCK